MLLYLSLSLLLLMGFTRSDPDPLQDFCVADARHPFYMNGAPCINPNSANASYFATSVLSKAGDTKNLFGFSVTLTNIVNLPGLNTMGLTMARVDLAPAGVVPLHAHPRASEVTICLKGFLLVGFVNTTNHLFTQQLRPGEAFVFPKGLMHFLLNLEVMGPSVAVSGLNSQNPGAQLAAVSAFTSNPPLHEEVLKKSFQMTSQDVMRIRRNLGG